MDKILERIVETDRQAREKVNNSRQRLETINEEIAAESEEYDRVLKEKAEKSVLETQEQMKAKLKDETERIDKYFTATEDALNKSYAQNHERWVNEIFSEVTK